MIGPEEEELFPEEEEYEDREGAEEWEPEEDDGSLDRAEDCEVPLYCYEGDDLMEKYSCFYCGAGDQTVPGKCSNCDRWLSGPVDEMTVKQLRELVNKQGLMLQVTVTAEGDPRFSLAS